MMKHLTWISKFLFLPVLSTIGILISSNDSAMAGNITITSYGHSALLIQGNGKSVLLNPFKAVGCAAGLKEPKLDIDLILASSKLADEGAQVANGIFLVEPGSYRVKGMNLEGFAAPHDRLNGRRFGQSTLWRWRQGGYTFAHLGGSAAPITGEIKILFGNPDVLIIGVGGGAKVYNGDEAAKVVKALKPKYVIPVQYVKDNTPKNCDQKGITSFLNAMQGIEVRKVGKSLTLSKRKNNTTIINILQ